MRNSISIIVASVLLAMLCLLDSGPASAARRSTPGWWDPDGVGTGTDWHYRVPVTLPAVSSVSSTARVDVDFTSLMAQLGISGTLDPNSVRVVRSNGTIATIQEFNPTIYGGQTNAVASRGEVRWLIEDAGSQTYYLYFDITANGSKPANPQTPINGNFEHSSAGTQLPAGWTSATRIDPAFDLQVRPSETVSVTSDGDPLQNPRMTDGTPRTGATSFLMGARSVDEPSLLQQNDTTVLTRQIAVPATNPGNLTVNWRTEGWDAASFAA